MSSPDELLADEPLIGPAARRSIRRWGLALMLAALGWSCLVFVDETEFVIVETFGRVSAVYDEVSEEKSDRGLHFKWPWPVGMARRFDRRLQVFDPPGGKCSRATKRTSLSRRTSAGALPRERGNRSISARSFATFGGWGIRRRRRRGSTPACARSSPENSRGSNWHHC